MNAKESVSPNAKDPICGMTVDPAKAAAAVDYDGATYHFCSQGCATKFRADPQKYLQPKPPVPVPAPTMADLKGADYTCPMHPEVHKDGRGDCPKCGMALEPDAIAMPTTRTQYTCPMHHQIVRDEPGSCPICGMALEPMTVTTNEANPELDSMSRRFWVGAVLTLPLLAIMVSDLLPSHPLQHLLRGSLLGWFEFVIATPCSLGRLAVLPTRLDVRRNAQPQHVYADFDWGGVYLAL